MASIARVATVRRALGSLQARIALMILLGVLPLALVSAVLAWQNYQSANMLGERRIAAMLAADIASLDDAIADARRGTMAIAQVPNAASTGCAEAIARFTAFTTVRVLALGVARPDGTKLCDNGHGTPEHTGLNATEKTSRVATIGRSPTGEIVLPVIFTGLAFDRTPIVVEADLLVTAAFGTGSAWLLPQNGARPLRLAGDLPLPRPNVLRHLLAGVPFVGRGAPQRGYVLGHLPDGTALVVGDRATRDEALASALLFSRFAVIALLLAAGVLMVMLAAHLTVAAPIRALTRRVTRWQAGEPFDSRPMRLPATELADLFAAFELATSGIVEREAALERSRAEQDLLFKEIHHRVKNNLQIIASLLNLQASRIRVPEARAEFQSARDRVRALATLHRHLYADGGVHTINMRPFLLELCGQLFQAIGEREGQRIILDVAAPELRMSSDQAVPLALVVTEAVSNAVKYAFPAGRAGRVDVCLTEQAADMLELVVQDNGIGIPAGRGDSETGVRDGLGIQLIRGFARQLGAELTVTENGGTRYRLVLKLHRMHEDYPAAVSG